MSCLSFSSIKVFIEKVQWSALLANCRGSRRPSSLQSSPENTVITRVIELLLGHNCFCCSLWDPILMEMAFKFSSGTALSLHLPFGNSLNYRQPQILAVSLSIFKLQHCQTIPSTTTSTNLWWTTARCNARCGIPPLLLLFYIYQLQFCFHVCLLWRAPQLASNFFLPSGSIVLSFFYHLSLSQCATTVFRKVTGLSSYPCQETGGGPLLHIYLSLSWCSVSPQMDPWLMGTAQ